MLSSSRGSWLWRASCSLHNLACGHNYPLRHFGSVFFLILQHTVWRRIHSILQGSTEGEPKWHFELIASPQFRILTRTRAVDVLGTFFSAPPWAVASCSRCEMIKHAFSLSLWRLYKIRNYTINSICELDDSAGVTSSYFFRMMLLLLAPSRVLVEDSLCDVSWTMFLIRCFGPEEKPGIRGPIKLCMR